MGRKSAAPGPRRRRSLAAKLVITVNDLTLDLETKVDSFDPGSNILDPRRLPAAQS